MTLKELKDRRLGVIEVEERAHEVAHRIFATIDCFAYAGEVNQEHSTNCKMAAREIAAAFSR